MCRVGLCDSSARQWHCFCTKDKESLSQADGSELYMKSVNDSN